MSRCVYRERELGEERTDSSLKVDWQEKKSGGEEEKEEGGFSTAPRTTSHFRIQKTKEGGTSRDDVLFKRLLILTCFSTKVLANNWP